MLHRETKKTVIKKAKTNKKTTTTKYLTNKHGNDGMDCLSCTLSLSPLLSQTRRGGGNVDESVFCRQLILTRVSGGDWLIVHTHSPTQTSYHSSVVNV